MKKQVVGILVLQVRLESLIGWSKEVDVGPAGFLYFVDRKGQVAAHPRMPSDGKIVDYSAVPVVQKAFSGKSGIELFFNTFENEERLFSGNQSRKLCCRPVSVAQCSSPYESVEKRSAS